MDFLPIDDIYFGPVQLFFLILYIVFVFYTILLSKLRVFSVKFLSWKFYMLLSSFISQLSSALCCQKWQTFWYWRQRSFRSPTCNIFHNSQKFTKGAKHKEKECRPVAQPEKTVIGRSQKFCAVSIIIGGLLTRKVSIKGSTCMIMNEHTNYFLFLSS